MDKIGHEIKGYSGYSLKKAEPANNQQLSPKESSEGNSKNRVIIFSEIEIQPE